MGTGTGTGLRLGMGTGLGTGLGHESVPSLVRGWDGLGEQEGGRLCPPALVPALP